VTSMICEKSRNNRIFSLLIFALFVAIPVHSISRTEVSANAPKGKIFRISQAVDIETLDPAIARTVEDGNVIEQIFEGLTIYNPKDASPIPGAAYKWKLSKDLKTYTFYLREDAKWSDGSRLVAKDFIFAWKRILNPKTGSPWAYQLFNIKNAREFYEGKIKSFKDVGLKAVKEQILEVKLLKPQPYFLGWLSHSSMMPVHRDTVDKHERKWTHTKNIVSNGAFIVTYREPKDKVVLKRNKHYWDAKKVFLDEVHFLGIENESTGLNMYETGLLDVDGGGLPAEQLDSLVTRNDIETANYLGTYFFRFNIRKTPFDNVNVRRAFNLAIDKAVIAEKILKGGRKPASNLVPSGIGWYLPPKGEQFNVEKARRALNSAGYCTLGILNVSCKPFPKVELLFNTLGNHKKIAVAMQAMLAQNLGIKINTVNKDYKTIQANAKNGNFLLVRGGWIGDYVDPATFVSLWLTDGGNNLTGWSNAEFDKLLEKAEKTVNLKARANLFGKAEIILNEELPFLPVYFFARLYLKKSYVKGYYTNILDKHSLKYVHF